MLESRSSTSMPTKWYWVMHGRLTRERKAYTSHRHSSITRPLPAARALKHQAPCLVILIHVHEHSTGLERVDALGLRAVEVIICMITRDFSVISIDVTGVSLSLSLSLSLPLTKVTHAQYRNHALVYCSAFVPGKVNEDRYTSEQSFKREWRQADQESFVSAFEGQMEELNKTGLSCMWQKWKDNFLAALDKVAPVSG